MVNNPKLQALKDALFTLGLDYVIIKNVDDQFININIWVGKS